MGQVNCPICFESIFDESEEQKTGGIIKTKSPANAKSVERDMEKPWDPESEDFLVTILCCHTFNWKCLSAWGDKKEEAELEVAVCPLCRFY
jgi:hypothetical protein